MENSNKVLLGQICKITDCEHKTAPNQDVGIPLIRTPNIGRGNLILGNVKRVSEEVYELWSRRGKPQSGDLIMAREAPVGNVAIVPKDLRVCLGQRTVLLRPDSKQVNSRYLNYLLNSNSVNSFLLSLSNGATVGHLNVGDIRKLTLPKLPSLPIQKKIAAVLFAYDDLIENNDRRIALLEKMAEEIYREWFVRLRFPGFDRATFHKGIPEGWEIKNFSEELDFKTGKLNSNAAILDGKYPFFTCSNETFKTNTFSFDLEGVLLAGNNAAGVYPLKYYLGRFDAYQRTYVITPKHKYLSVKFIFFMLKDRLDYLQSISIGAATQFLTLQMLNSLKLLKPNENLVVEFEQFVQPIFKEKFLLEMKKENLKQTRDRLLTRLISGKLSVEDLDIQFPPSMTTDP